MLKGKNLFIVEDNSMNRVVYTIMLKKEGCYIEFDRWGRDTIKALKNKTYDLIILDLMLPQGASGFSIFEEIRSQPNYQTVPIIAISASDPNYAIPKAQELGFDGFIAKPLDKNIFPEQLQRILNGEKIWYSGNEPL